MEYNSQKRHVTFIFGVRVYDIGAKIDVRCKMFSKVLWYQNFFNMDEGYQPDRQGRLP